MTDFFYGRAAGYAGTALRAKEGPIAGDFFKTGFTDDAYRNISAAGKAVRRKQDFEDPVGAFHAIIK